MEIIWKDVSLDDRALIEAYYEYEQCENCEFTFVNNYLWSPFYGMKYTIIEDMLVFSVEEEGLSVSFPLAKDAESESHRKQVLLVLEEYFEEQKQPFLMHIVTEKNFAVLEEMFPGKYEIEYIRDDADYVYETAKLISLSGKKLHGKRNHINRFKENHPNWSYESLSEENTEECLTMAEQWKEMNLCQEKGEKHEEYCITRKSIREFRLLGLKGGVLKDGERVVAFSLGEPLNKDTFVVHIEKAFADVQGAYPMINQQFLLHEAENYTYVNREEDTGEEGLRKAKLSYYPAFLVEKGNVRLKAGK